MKDNAERSLRIIAGGDVCPGSSELLGRKAPVGSVRLLRDVEPILGAADLGIVNLEGWITEQRGPLGNRFAGRPAFIRMLREAGINLVSVANNHVFDGGVAGFEETCRICHEEGVMLLGLRGSNGFFSQPLILDRNGLKLGLLAYTWSYSAASGQRDRGEHDRVAVILDGLVNYTWNRTPDADRKRRLQPRAANEHVFRDVARLREQADIVVVVTHWGFEWNVYPPLGVVLEAESFLDAGVDLILGGHPHVVQGVLERPGKLCAFSLGNLIFDGRSRHSVLLEVDIGKRGVKKWEMHPIWLKAGHTALLATGRRERRIRAQVARSSAAVRSPERNKVLDDEIIYLQYERGYQLNKARKVLFLLLTSLVRPPLLSVVMRKVGNLFEIARKRLRGHRVRW